MFYLFYFLGWLIFPCAIVSFSLEAWNVFVPGVQHDWPCLQSPFCIWNQGSISRGKGSASALTWLKGGGVLVVARSGFEHILFWKAGTASDPSVGPDTVSLLWMNLTNGSDLMAFSSPSTVVCPWGDRALANGVESSYLRFGAQMFRTNLGRHLGLFV